MKVNGEILVERTIRLLKENGIKDIAISTNNPAFDYLNVEKLRHKNEYIHDNPERHKKSKNSWLNAYYPINTPACYLCGDVYYTENAIKTIIDTKTMFTMFFAVPDRQDGRKHPNIKGREPLGYKVNSQRLFRKAINELFEMIDNGMFKSDPISWNLYRKLNNLPLDFNGYGNNIFNTKGDFLAIDDMSTDIDSEKDIEKLERLIKVMKGGNKMIKVKVIEEFHLGKFNELKNIQRISQNENGKLFVGDIFECTEDMAKYLLGENALKRAFVEIIEIIPEKQEENEIISQKTEEKPKRKTTTRKTTKKTIAKK